MVLAILALSAMAVSPPLSRSRTTLKAIIEEARRRARKRRLTYGAAAFALLLAVGIFLAVGQQGSPPTRVQPTARPIPTVASSIVLVRQPWIGVACPPPAPFACDRVGLAISLRTRAVAATATINGQSFKLNSREWSDHAVGAKHRALAGFLQPAAFLKRGPFKTITDRAGQRHRVTVEHVHLVIDYGAGRKIQTSIRELGYGGWG